MELKKWAHEFAEKEIRPVAAQYDESEEFPWPVLKKAAEAGLYSLDIYMQAQQDPTGLTLPILMEETFWGCAGIGLAIFGTGLPLSSLAATGTPEQLFEWAPKMFGTPEDPKVASFCVTEPQAGSDVRSLRTRAVRDGDEWVINGTKVFITNGQHASVYIVVATVDPELGHRGQASFIVSRDDPGVRPGKKEKKLGIRASDTSEVIFEDCRVPLDRVVGGLDRLEQKLKKARRGESTGRSSAALRTFEVTRPSVAIQAVGIARAALEFAIDYARERSAFGVPIAQHQAIQHKLADMAVEVEASRLLVYKAAWLAASGQPFPKAEGSMSKLKASETAVRVTEQAVQVLGGYGFIRDFPVEKWYRDSKIYTIFEGTSEIQRLVIARALLDQH
ncbi:MAG TPA: acyl-CoA dehydrogenase family protein [Actinomycetota bacterium]|jgi:alkylation response protein AidB-like acyl-CoA dehydrogenase|nr:acyl-CoA dehydrogenase family protein [Actinomycetota bacterium]